MQGMLKMSKINVVCSVQNNVKDVRDIKTSHNRFLTYFIIVKDVEDVYELQCRF